MAAIWLRIRTSGWVRSAIKSHSSHSSSFQVCLPWFLGTGHWIGGTLFSRLIGSNAAGTVIDDAESISLGGLVSESTRQSNGLIYVR